MSLRLQSSNQGTQPLLQGSPVSWALTVADYFLQTFLIQHCHCCWNTKSFRKQIQENVDSTHWSLSTPINLGFSGREDREFRCFPYTVNARTRNPTYVSDLVEMCAVEAYLATERGGWPKWESTDLGQADTVPATRVEMHVHIFQRDACKRDAILKADWENCRLISCTVSCEIRQ